MPRVPRRNEQGASAIELSILAPALLLVIFTLIQVGLWGYGRDVALQSAREGVAQLRLVQPSADTQAAEVKVEKDVQDYAGSLGGASLSKPVADAEYGVGDGQREVRVTVSGGVVTLVPGLHFTVKRSVIGQIEVFQEDQQ